VEKRLIFNETKLKVGILIELEKSMNAAWIFRAILAPKGI
jgi:hypothetical protein